MPAQIRLISLQIKGIYLFFFKKIPQKQNLKNLLTKRNDACLFDCYELTKDVKSRLLTNELSKAKLMLIKIFSGKL